MEQEQLDDVTLIGYIDDVENSRFYANKHKLGHEVLEGLGVLHGGLVDLGPLIRSEEDVNTLKKAIGSQLDDLKDCCIAANDQAAQARISVTEKTISSVRTALLN